MSESKQDELLVKVMHLIAEVWQTAKEGRRLSNGHNCDSTAACQSIDDRITNAMLYGESKREQEAGELKDCPFCGCPPFYGGYPDVRIECRKCKQAIVKASWYDGNLGLVELSWNKRATPTQSE